jgi:hypothetical protein
MSALGHKRTFGPLIAMSTLPPQKRTLISAIAMSALCQKRTHAVQQLMPRLGQVLPDFCQ